jgi:hypothetical protein
MDTQTQRRETLARVMTFAFVLLMRDSPAQTTSFEGWRSSMLMQAKAALKESLLRS